MTEVGRLRTMMAPRDLHTLVRSTQASTPKKKETTLVRMLSSRPAPHLLSSDPASAYRLLATTLAVVLLALATSSVQADAREPRYSPLDGSTLELTKLIPPSESVTAYTAPSDMAMVLTRFCGDQCVSCQGTSLGAGAFQTGRARCVRHQPGIELPPGETVRCTNHCSTMNAALFSGVRRP